MTSKAMTWKNIAIFYFDYQELSLMKHKKFKGDNELFFFFKQKIKRYHYKHQIDIN